MIIVLTEDGKPVEAFFKNDGTDEEITIDRESPIAKLIKMTAEN